jgi:plasmid stabilization system protein ParE
MAQTTDTTHLPIDESAAWRAVADWYRAYFTGIVLSTVARRGPARAAELVEAIFSHQRLERFLPGLKKLGIDHLPAAVAAARQCAAAGTLASIAMPAHAGRNGCAHTCASALRRTNSCRSCRTYFIGAGGAAAC